MKKYDSELDEFYYKEVMGGFSKNHQMDDEGSRQDKGATIPFRASADGFNPGEFVEDFIHFLHPANEHIFQRPLRDCNQNDIHKDTFGPKAKPYFENQKVGVHFVANMLPKVIQFFLAL